MRIGNYYGEAQDDSCAEKDEKNVNGKHEFTRVRR